MVLLGFSHIANIYMRYCPQISFFYLYLEKKVLIPAADATGFV